MTINQLENPKLLENISPPFKKHLPNFKLSYIKVWDNWGVVYNQRIKTNLWNLFIINEEIEKEIKGGFKRANLYCPQGVYHAALFLKALNTKAKVVYLDATQLKFISVVCGVEFKERNSYIVVDSKMCSFGTLRQN